MPTQIPNIPNVEVVVVNPPAQPVPVSLQGGAVNVNITPAKGIVLSEWVGAFGKALFTAPPDTAWDVYVQLVAPSEKYTLLIGPGAYFGNGTPPAPAQPNVSRQIPDTEFGKSQPLVGGESIILTIANNGKSKWYIQLIQR